MLPEPFRSTIRTASEFRSTLTSETDRGCALMAAAFLDEELMRLITAKLVDDSGRVAELFRVPGPLATFSSRIDLAYLLGLIPPNAKRDLDLVRKIRNAFAHTSGPLTFEENRIANMCRELALDGVKRTAPPRSKFTRATMGVLGVIHEGLWTTSHENPKPDHDIRVNQAGMQAFHNAFKELDLPSDLQAIVDEIAGHHDLEDHDRDQ